MQEEEAVALRALEALLAGEIDTHLKYIVDDVKLVRLANGEIRLVLQGKDAYAADMHRPDKREIPIYDRPTYKVERRLMDNATGTLLLRAHVRLPVLGAIDPAFEDICLSVNKGQVHAIMIGSSDAGSCSSSYSRSIRSSNHKGLIGLVTLMIGVYGSVDVRRLITTSGSARSRSRRSCAFASFSVWAITSSGADGTSLHLKLYRRGRRARDCRPAAPPTLTAPSGGPCRGGRRSRRRARP
jgi:hypothetical protein